MWNKITNILGIALLGLMTTYSAPAMAIEEPEFELIATIGELEIRKYRPQIIARTLIPGSFDDVGNQGFRRLAGYIFGANASDQKIAMTAPVVQFPDGSENSSDGQPLAGAYWMTFTMPAEHKLEDLPRPLDDRVELVTTPEQYLAVLRYKGSWSEKRYRQHETKLIDALNGNSDWVPRGEPLWARYNSPLTPWFMRENEVAIVVMPRSESLSAQLTH